MIQLKLKCTYYENCVIKGNDVTAYFELNPELRTIQRSALLYNELNKISSFIKSLEGYNFTILQFNAGTFEDLGWKWRVMNLNHVRFYLVISWSTGKIKADIKESFQQSRRLQLNLKRYISVSPCKEEEVKLIQHRYLLRMSNKLLDSKVSVHGFKKPYVKVTNPKDSCYQAAYLLTDLPSKTLSESYFYGIYQLCNELNFLVDIISYVSVKKPNIQKILKQKRQLADQHNELSGYHTPDSVESLEEDLDIYHNELSNGAVPISVITTFHIWHSRVEKLQLQCDALEELYRSHSIELSRFRGEQIPLITGSRLPTHTLKHKQHLTNNGFALLGSLVNYGIYDKCENLYAKTVDTNYPQSIMIDWQQSKNDISPSVGYVGELGSGKSVAMKRSLYDIYKTDKKSQILIFDRTVNQEWKSFVSTFAKYKLINLASDTNISLDPFRLFKHRKHEHAELLLTRLLGISPLSYEGALLSKKLNVLLSEEQPLNTLLNYINIREDKALYHKLSALIDRKQCNLFFDNKRLPLSLEGSRIIIFDISQIELPQKEDVNKTNEQMPFAQILGQSLLYIISSYCREISLESNNFVASFIDEAWWLLSTDIGRRVLMEWIRDGRKHNAAVHIATHDPIDFTDNKGQDTLSGLLGAKMAFRYRSTNLINRALSFLGLEKSEDKELFNLYSDIKMSGVALISSFNQDIALGKIVLPISMFIRNGIFTTPNEKTNFN